MSRKIINGIEMELITVISDIVNTRVLKNKLTLQANDEIISRNILSSIEFIQLINALEITFNITIEDEEFVPENFNSISQIHGFVSDKCKGAKE